MAKRAKASGSIGLVITGDEQDAIKALNKTEREVTQLKQKLAGLNKEGTRTKQVTREAFDAAPIARMVAGVATLTAGIAAGTKGWQTYLAQMRQISTEAQKAGDELVALAALQEGGKKAEAVERSTALASRYGIHDRGEAYSTVQAMQSTPYAGGDLDIALNAAETIFAATQLGIPLESGRALEVLGSSQGQAPGEALRRAYIAGEESAQTPAVLASAAAGLTFWEDKEAGFAAASVLAGGVKPDQLETFVKAAGMALSGESTLKDTFRKLGVADASRLERLRALGEAGIVTEEELARVGLTEMRQRQALATLIPNVEKLEKVRSVIQEKATPGLFARERRELESELPWLKTTREIDILESKYRDATAFGPRAEEALELDRKQRIRGIAFRRQGIEVGPFGWNYLDEQGRATRFDESRLFLDSMMWSAGQEPGNTQESPYDRFREEQERVRSELEKDMAASLGEAAEKLGKAADKLNIALDRAEGAARNPMMNPLGEEG